MERFFIFISRSSQNQRDRDIKQKIMLRSQWGQAVFGTHMTNCAIPFSGAKRTCCKGRSGIVLPCCSLQTSLRHCPRTKSQQFRAGLCNLESADLISGHFQKFRSWYISQWQYGIQEPVWLTALFKAALFVLRGEDKEEEWMCFIFTCKRSLAEVVGWDARTYTSKLPYSFLVHSVLLRF